jgi:hypothetical protein
MTTDHDTSPISFTAFLAIENTIVEAGKLEQSIHGASIIMQDDDGYVACNKAIRNAANMATQSIRDAVTRFLLNRKVVIDRSICHIPNASPGLAYLGLHSTWVHTPQALPGGVMMCGCAIRQRNALSLSEPTSQLIPAPERFMVYRSVIETASMGDIHLHHGLCRRCQTVYWSFQADSVFVAAKNKEHT